MPVPRRIEDWEGATRKGVILTLCIVFATIAHAASVGDAALSLNDMSVLAAIVVQTVTIGYFAGSHSTRISNLEKQREEDREESFRRCNDCTKRSVSERRKTDE